MKELKSNYARIDTETGVIELLYENKPKTNGFDLIIEDCELHFDELNNCIISGYKWEWGFVFEKTFLSKLKYPVIDTHTKLGYETLLDRWKGLKTAYVNGWHRKSENKLYKAVVSKFFVVL
jgi:hypothetical protein